MDERGLDQLLVEQAQRGDKHAFELLVSKYQRKLARLLSRFIRDSTEVEDVTQETFIKAYRALREFRGDRSEEHTSELQSQSNLVCRLLLEKKKKDDMNKDICRKKTEKKR